MLEAAKVALARTDIVARAAHTPGGDGGRGGNATRPTNAEHSRSIVIELEEVAGANGTPQFRVQGQFNHPNGRVDSQISELFVVSPNGYVVKDRTGVTDHVQSLSLDSSGTRAHDGADGGRGGDGARGSSGSDATQWSSGTDGGSGGDGGDGGHGTDGADSGDAGDTIVTLDEDQTHLIAYIEETRTPGLINGSIQGGEATRPGSHGAGGSGGRGGSGGSSYSWTTTTTHSRTNSDGESETYTETHYHSNPGGSDGSSGRSGITPTSPLRAGRAGKNASFVIRVKKKNGQIQEYRQGRYDLSIVQSARYRSSPVSGIADGLIEPDEPVEVRYLIKNDSGMPTPKRVVHLHVLDSQGVIVPDKTVPIVIPELQPGQAFETQPKNVLARSSVNLPVRGDAIVEGGRIRQRLVQTGTGETADGNEGRDYKRASAMVTPFEIQQSVRLSNQKDIRGSTTLAAGEETWVEIRVHNNSPISDAGEDATVKRRIETAVKFETVDGLGPEQIEAFGVDGQRINLANEIRQAHRKIAPGESSVVKVKVKIRDVVDAKAYSTGQLMTALSRGPLQELMGSKAIQIQDFKVQFVKAFQPSSDPDVVLVTNSDTPRELVEGIKEKFEAMGKKVEDYNLSYYGALDSELPPLSRLKKSTHRTLLVLDNPHGAQRERASYYLKLDQTLKAASQSSMRTMFVGPGTAGTGIEERARPLEASIPRDVVSTRRRFIWGSTANHVSRVAQEKSERLAQEFPERNYLVVANTPEMDLPLNRGSWKNFWTKFGAFFSARPPGSYTLVRGLDRGEAAVSLLNVPEAQMASAEFVQSPLWELAYLKQLPFSEKLETLRKINGQQLGSVSATPNSPSGLTTAGKALYASILSDLAEELQFARKNKSEALPKLRQLSTAKGIGSIRDKKGDFLTNVLADLEHMLTESDGGGVVSD